MPQGNKNPDKKTESDRERAGPPTVNDGGVNELITQRP